MKKLFAILLLILGIFLILFKFNFNFTGNSISNYFSGFLWMHILGFVFLIGGLIFMVNKKLEAIVVPTGPSYEVDSQRANAGIKEYGEDQSRLVMISGEINEKEGKRNFIGSQPMKIYKQMRKAGIPKNHFIFESKSHNTKENVKYICEKLEKLKEKEDIKELIINTDKGQAKRFKMLFDIAKKEGFAPQNLEIKTYSKGIERAYGPIKASLAYLKDYLTFGRELKEYKKK